uniref:Uncharacterized protein n=1 Tax=Oryza barthii TaxID=65489 RepID=A0A0D3FHB3_9ORYZ
MEDSVGEEERREQQQEETMSMAQGKERGGEEDAGGGGESGFLTTMASKIGAAVSGADGSGGAEEEGGEGDGDVNVGGGVETDGDGGFLTTMASKIGAAMSGGNGNGRAEEEEGGERNGDENVVAASGGGEEERKRKRDCNGGGGIFSKLMSGSPDSLPASADHIKIRLGTVEAEENEREGGDQGGEKAGILSTVASKIGIAMSGADGRENHGNEDDAKIRNGNAADHGKAEEKRDEPNGGGIVKQIMSNLPADDQAPDAEEASLLIAIIDD